MTLIIELNAKEEARLAAEARLKGIDPAEFARKLVTDYLDTDRSEIPDTENQAFIALLRSWSEEDASDDIAELTRRDVETAQFLNNLEANRLTLRDVKRMIRVMAVILDSTPVGLVTQKAGKSAEADTCREWMENLLAQGVRIYIPEIADYEVRRELLRAGQTNSIKRLDKLKEVARYIPITTDIMLDAARLWAEVRKLGITTSHDQALDGDVIVSAQALSLRLAPDEFVVATSNVKHLSHFAPANLWQNISL